MYGTKRALISIANLFRCILFLCDLVAYAQSVYFFESNEYCFIEDDIKQWFQVRNEFNKLT